MVVLGMLAVGRIVVVVLQLGPFVVVVGLPLVVLHFRSHQS